MPALAHSARPKRGLPAQPYREHISAVERKAIDYASDVARFWIGDREAFREVVREAARWHDLGKLDPENQRVLAGGTREPLPCRHEYAGVRYLRERHERKAAVLVYSHHAGLPNWAECIGRPLFEATSDEGTRKRAHRLFEQYVAHHETEFGEDATAPAGDGRRGLGDWSGLAWRFALSCLVDADHSDTACHYSQEFETDRAPVRWAERRLALDRHVNELQAQQRGNPARNELRQQVYETCRNLEPTQSIYACDSGVGTGKTTAVMAHLLRVAHERALRHIFVVLPYTNIINQSVKTYRKALLLDAEDPERVVAAHHHQVEFHTPELRQLATLWDCPITVTTAVQFFETVAASHPARLRKLHELAGSAVFIDEAHAAIPAWLWPQTWIWMQELAHHWGCHFVLASGSLVRFWEHGDFVQPPVQIPDLVPHPVRARVQAAERRRVKYQRIAEPLSVGAVITRLDAPGPRLLIVNTVRSAAVIANEMCKSGRDVMHLSTALAPIDRDRIVKLVEQRLQQTKDQDWTLVATSCVEAGMELDFRWGMREMASAASMLQVGGRINRHGGEHVDSFVWIITLDDTRTRRNPAMKLPAKVLADLFAADLVKRLFPSQLCMEALARELNEAGGGDFRGIKKAEAGLNFPEVSSKYRVIEDETVMVLVNPALQRLENGERLQRIDMLRGSVRIRKSDVGKHNVRVLRDSDELYAWTLDYDPEFLGYMKGVLKTDAAMTGEFLGV